MNHDDPALKTALKLLQDNLRVTTEAGNRIATIVKSLKTFARLDEAEYQTVDLHEGIDSSLTLIANELRGRIAVEKHYAENGRLTCYASQLNQVFITLLKNAAAAIEGNGTILIRTERHDGMMHIPVRFGRKAKWEKAPRFSSICPLYNLYDHVHRLHAHKFSKEFHVCLVRFEMHLANVWIMRITRATLIKSRLLCSDTA